MRLGSLLFLLTVFLAAVGIFILYESSSYSALLNVGDKYYFVKNQIISAIFGIVACLVVSQVNYKKFYSLALPVLLITILFLIAVFLPGIGVKLKGAHRWVNLRFSVFQPSELLKISLSLYLAAWLSVKETGRLLAFMLLFGLCVLLVVIQPDMGTAFIIAVTAIVMYFLSGAHIRDMLILVALLLFGAFMLIKIEPYRLARLTSYQNINSKDLSGTSYHVKQILVALGSGGIGGVGFGKSIQKYAYLPENTTDSIFAIYAEESGFVGSILLMGLFFLEMILGFAIASRAPDEFGRLLAGGIAVFIGVQALINIASQATLIPLTGVPLPFISYGGSSMFINFVSVGIILSIGRGKTSTVKHVNKRV